MVEADEAAREGDRLKVGGLFPRRDVGVEPYHFGEIELGGRAAVVDLAVAVVVQLVATALFLGGLFAGTGVPFPFAVAGLCAVLADAHADFVSYPSLYEGFGNALLEAIYFRQPTLVNRYSVYVADIAPLGLDLIEIEGHIGRDAVEAVIATVTSEKRRRRMVDTNFDLAAQHFSFEVLEERLSTLIAGV